MAMTYVTLNSSVLIGNAVTKNCIENGIMICKCPLYCDAFFQSEAAFYTWLGKLR